MSYAYRFTDTHVRKHPTLVAIAIEYAKQYCGDFEPMLEAKDTLRRTGVLPIAQTRKVLNILRQELDPDVASLQVEAVSVLEEMGAEVEAVIRRSGFKVIEDKPRAEEPKERPYSITTQARVNRPYVMPRPRQGAIHVVDWAECVWEFPSLWEARKMKPELRTVRRPKLRVIYECGNETDNSPRFMDEAGMRMALDVEGRRHCVRCFPV